MAIAEETNDAIFYPSEEFRQNAHIRSMDEYARKYKESIDDPEGFWSEMAQDYFFKLRPSTEKGEFLQFNFDITKGPIKIEWMKGATTNICYNVVDRIIEKGKGDRYAYICVGSEPGHERKITYNELKAQVCKLANVYRSKGIRKGDRIACYMPMTVELVISMLAAARIGAIHSVVFAGFSSDALAERIVDAKCKILITADGVFRGSKFIPLKEIVDSAVDKCQRLNHHITNVIVYHHLKCPAQLVNGYRSNGINGTSGTNNNNCNGNNQYSTTNGSSGNTTTTSASSNGSNGTNGHSVNGTKGLNSSNGFTNGNGCSNGFTNGQSNGVTKTKNSPVPSITWNPKIDLWWHEVMDKSAPECEPVWVDAEDPLFILYTSGSTGKPKGVVHTTGGYMVYAGTTFKYVFHYLGGDVFFCTADLGWITGHTVNVYGALANGATIVLFDGTPFYPDPGRLWQIVDRYQVATFYTAPTAIRALMKYGDSYVKKYSRASLRLLGTAGEPINPEAWYWYYRVVGSSRCPIVDTFWQTETAAPMLTSLPGCTPMKPGSATFPFFGVVPAVLNDDGKELSGDCSGHLVFKAPWPAILRTVDGNHPRYELTYFSKFPGYYYSGDGVKRDKDGYYWVTGRTDDLLNVSGHLLSTAEVESALLEHEAVAETAAVSSIHPIKGESIYCFVVLKDGHEYSKELDNNMKQKVRAKIGAIAAPEVIHFASALPKTRSGKIVRRILRKIAREALSSRSELDEDLTTVADTDIIDELIRTRDLYIIT